MNIFNYYYWRMSHTHNGMDLIIPDIEHVESYSDITTHEFFDLIMVSLKKNNLKKEVVRYSLYNTEREALYGAVCYLKEAIFDIINKTGCHATPRNANIWIKKARDQLKIFFDKYCDKYPEIFI